MLAALNTNRSTFGLRSKILAICLTLSGLAWLASGGPQWPLGVSLILLALAVVVGGEQNRVDLFLSMLALTAVVVAALLSPPHGSGELEATPPTFWPRFRTAFVFVSLLIPVYLGAWVSLSASGNLSRPSQHFAAGLGFVVLLGSLVWLLPLPWDWPGKYS